MKKNTRFAVLSILVFLILAVAFLADKIVPYDPLSASLSDAFQAPGKEHYFGTDALGRDVFSRVICGATTGNPGCGYLSWNHSRVFRRSDRRGNHESGRYDDCLPGSDSGYGNRGNSWAKPEKFHDCNRGGKLDQIRQTFQKPGAEDTEQDLYIRGGNLRIQTQQNR